jgi:hypothetical protein
LGAGVAPSKQLTEILPFDQRNVPPKGDASMEIVTELLDQLNSIPPILIFIALLIPFALVWLVTFVFGYFIARRKGVGIFGALIGTFPVWSVPVLLWWASLTDKEVLERLSKFDGRT